MGQMFDAVVEYFKEEEFKYSIIEGKTMLTFGMSGRSGHWNCMAHAREKQEQFVLYSILPIKVPKEKRPEIMEFITRANYGMVVGAFEMDLSDGEVRFKTSIDTDGLDLEERLIKPIVGINLSMVDRYLPGMMKVLYGGVSPEAAVDEVESRKVEDLLPSLDED